jgi:hypothetical protein
MCSKIEDFWHATKSLISCRENETFSHATNKVGQHSLGIRKGINKLDRSIRAYAMFQAPLYFQDTHLVECFE